MTEMEIFNLVKDFTLIFVCAFLIFRNRTLSNQTETYMKTTNDSIEDIKNKLHRFKISGDKDQLA